MDAVLGGLEHARAYIDNVRRETLLCIKQAGVTIKPSKCVFGKVTMQFLGHRLGEGKVHPQSAKVEVIQNYKKPRTKKDFRVFIGLLAFCASLPVVSQLNGCYCQESSKGVAVERANGVGVPLSDTGTDEGIHFKGL